MKMESKKVERCGKHFQTLQGNRAGVREKKREREREREGE